jgi:hypothetical protein
MESFLFFFGSSSPPLFLQLSLAQKGGVMVDVEKWK